jgi:NAD(P)-dependent dehydrogenase (short-subunit alcohol dehydrogenase family)
VTAGEARSVLVTGGASGFGRATVERFADGGAVVFLADIDERGSAVAEELSAAGKAVRYVACDVTQADDVRAAVSHVVDLHGRIDVMVNNAGVLGGGWMHETDADLYCRRHVEVNLIGVWNGCRAAMMSMRQAGGGVIVNVASPAGTVPTPAAVAYGLTKAAVIHLTKSLAIGYAHDGIRVNAVLPGPAITGIFDGADIDLIELERNYVSRIPIGRIADVDDVARAIEFLAAQSSSFVTGAVLNVDGGFTPALPPEVFGQ